MGSVENGNASMVSTASSAWKWPLAATAAYATLFSAFYFSDRGIATLLLALGVSFAVLVLTGRSRWGVSLREAAASPDSAGGAGNADSSVSAIPTTIDTVSYVRHSPIAVALVDAEGRILETNAAFDALPGMTAKSVQLTDVTSSPERVTEMLRRAAAGEAMEGQEVTLSGNSERSAMLYLSRIDGETSGKYPHCMLVHLIDISARKQLEAQFTHSQKMQAVGQLAGGIAHDFNNLLTAMIGHCDLLLMRHAPGDQSFSDIMQVKQNANRAANLVRQLLAFSRRQTLQPKVLDITDVLAELSHLIRRLIGENITLSLHHARDLWPVKADQGQWEQVLINLVVNARDAMPDGGELRIETANMTIPPGWAPPSGTYLPEEESPIPGDYVQVTVGDTGAGIPEDVLTRIFEPFFSTKGVGEGTGLGLATVHGIVRQTGGYILVHSTAGGTVFTLLFARHVASRDTENRGDGSDDSAEKAEEEASAPDLTGQSTVLLVEDEEAVRMFATRALRNKGYEVLEADCGESALEALEAYDGSVEVIVTDVMMPGMTGPAMVAQARRCQPEARIVYISGYAEDALEGQLTEGEDAHFLPKPFSLKQLAEKVKELT